MEDYPNKTGILRQHFKNFCTEYIRYSKNPITLSLASENMLDSLFMQRLSGNDLLPIIDSSHLLVETSYYISPFHFKELLEQIMNKGYTLILAHPERYLYMNESDYQQLKSINVQFQLNQFSLLCLYGKEVKKKALMLQKLRMYDYTGTDLHRLNTLNRAICL